jgi:hypothetical protein
MKRLYLDVCTLCRPFDDQNAMRIRLETDAYYLILQNVQSRKYTMIASPIHFEEIDAIEDARERLEVKALLNKYGVQPSVFFISCDDSLLKKCKKHKIGIEALNPVEFCVKENLR